MISCHHVPPCGRSRDPGSELRSETRSQVGTGETLRRHFNIGCEQTNLHCPLVIGSLRTDVNTRSELDLNLVPYANLCANPTLASSSRRESCIHLLSDVSPRKRVFKNVSSSLVLWASAQTAHSAVWLSVFTLCEHIRMFHILLGTAWALPWWYKSLWFWMKRGGDAFTYLAIAAHFQDIKVHLKYFWAQYCAFSKQSNY